MAENYTIKLVSQKPPREWSFKAKDGSSTEIKMKTYKVILEERSDLAEGVDVNRKADGEPPKAGETLTGTIEPTDFGYKFKPERQTGGYGGRGGYQRDDKEIRAQMAVKAATDYAAQRGLETTDIPDLAFTLYTLVAELKKDETPKPAAQGDDLKQAADTALGGGTTPVDASEAPF